VVVDQRHVLATERELYAEPVPHLFPRRSPRRRVVP
jgi:hypothetical protein